VVPSAHVIFFFTPCSAAEKDFLPKALVVGDLTAHGSYIRPFHVCFGTRTTEQVEPSMLSSRNNGRALAGTSSRILLSIRTNTILARGSRYSKRDHAAELGLLSPMEEKFYALSKRVLCRVSKSILYSTNLLPSVFYQQRNFCRVLFSNTRQRKALGKLRIGKKFKKKTAKHSLKSQGQLFKPYPILSYSSPYHFSLLF
jgi:hypothetical protein